MDPTNFMPNPFYWQGNEEDLFAPYQFAFIADGSYQYLTSMYVRKLLAAKFLNSPHGLPGNDDYGTMSGWAVFGYLGFYPRAGDGMYILGSPLFSNVTIHRQRGDIHILAYNNSLENMFVKLFKVNGIAQTLPFFNIKDVVNGGTLEFWMTDIHS
ncbi:hypothetical protein RFI_09216 [Reticulomyxa filosa]|uniref:Glycosyl hydrolase family 92 domain-containing protein n=1 Tax=Reticulomyxa filosa TaxID=46433 RepID=X6NNT3_RETFI|nr:hypothetical protein RFI_09216 [Reticulomyxa filosa]|eukprot:ETO27915.1 hypothetical protein RFI_09216 [Reticulomyxa filosa]